MIGQCLSNKNESATVAKNKKFCELNKAEIFVLWMNALIHEDTHNADSIVKSQVIYYLV